MKIVAVIVTYNRKDLLKECINAIIAQDRSVDSIIIIDNASTDGTSEMFSSLGEFNRENIEYKRLNKNIGGAGGFYEGLKSTLTIDADWAWIMDDDTIAGKDTLSEMCKALDFLDSNTSFLASSIFGIHGEPMNVPELDNRRSENGYQDWYKYLNKGLLKIEDATFVSILINIEAIKKVGLPYKEFFIWGDDKEYTLRLSHYFGPAYMVGKSKAIHKRKVTKRISIENETDPQRIRQYYYNYRNILVNVHEYRRGGLSVLKRILEFEALCLKILMDKNQTYKWTKVITIQRGIWGYFNGSYNKTKFKHRMIIDNN